MDIRFEDQGNGRYRIVDQEEDRQLGIIVPQRDGSFGYSLFGTPHMGSESSLEKVQKAIERHLE